jgi:precorrin-2 dehydrogenase/sirohydrochlorin ferrochelatase
VVVRVPLWVEASSLRVLVIGGGGVGTRRALWFHRAGARVRVVSLDFTQQLVEEARKSKRLELVKLDARDEAKLEPHVAWSSIVVITVPDSSVRDRVWRLAKRYGCLVNDAVDASRTEVVVPFVAEVYDGGLKIAVTSEGLTGIAARHARDRVVKCLESDNELRTLFEVMWRVKLAAKKLCSDVKARIQLYFDIERMLFSKNLLKRGIREALTEAAKLLAQRLGVDSEKVLQLLQSLGRPKPSRGG